MQKKLARQLVAIANDLDAAGLYAQADLIDSLISKVLPSSLKNKIKDTVEDFKRETDNKGIVDTISHLPDFIEKEFIEPSKEKLESASRPMVSRPDTIPVPAGADIYSITSGIVAVQNDSKEGTVITVADPVLYGIGNMLGFGDDSFVYSGLTGVTLSDGDKVSRGDRLGSVRSPGNLRPAYVKITKMVDGRPQRASQNELRIAIKDYVPPRGSTGSGKPRYVDINSTAASLPVDAPIKGTPGERDADKYNEVIDQFAVDKNPRYTPRALGNSKKKNTFCNIFVSDVTAAMGSPLPHWVDRDGNPGMPGRGFHELNGNASVDWLINHGSRFGWREVDEHEAQRYANSGHPVVAGQKNVGTSKIGHVAIVRPGSIKPGAGPAVANAGGRNINYSHIANVFGPSQYKNNLVRYWAAID